MDRVGRMAGQFAKPRSDSFEERDKVKFSSYRGDNINRDAFDSKSRITYPQRMIRDYCQSAATLKASRTIEMGKKRKDTVFIAFSVLLPQIQNKSQQKNGHALVINRAVSMLRH